MCNSRIRQEIQRLKAKNVDLLGQLKRLSEEFDKKIARVERSNKKGPQHVVSEGRLMNELDCLDKTQKILEKEIEMLKSKVSMDTSYERVVYLESTFASNKQRNEATVKEIRDKSKQVKKVDKEITLIKTKESPSPQIEVFA